MTATTRGHVYLAGRPAHYSPPIPSHGLGETLTEKEINDDVEKDKKATIDPSSTFASSYKLYHLRHRYVTATWEPPFSHLYNELIEEGQMFPQGYSSKMDLQDAPWGKDSMAKCFGEWLPAMLPLRRFSAHIGRSKTLVVLQERYLLNP